MNKHNEAHSLIKRGYQVYTILPNSKGGSLAGTHGALDATTDYNVIDGWFEHVPKANLGIRLDQAGLIMVDIDRHGKKDGVQTLRDLTQRGYKLPNDTYIEKTPNGGLHYFFSMMNTGHLKANQEIYTGIEVRTDSTIIAPSEVNGKSYQAIDDRTLADVKPAPQWLVDKLTNQKVNWPSEHACTTRQKKYTGRLLDEMVSGTTQGNRNDWLTKMIGKLFATGAEPETIYDLALSINQRFINQPLKEKEVTTIYNSILKREMKRFERNAVRNSRIAG